MPVPCISTWTCAIRLEKRNECEGKLPAESSRKQMECNEYFFLRATALV